MVGMGFRRIALAQGLLDGPIGRNGPPLVADRDDRASDREPMRVKPSLERPGKDSPTDNRVRVTGWRSATTVWTARYMLPG